MDWVSHALACLRFLTRGAVGRLFAAALMTACTAPGLSAPPGYPQLLASLAGGPLRTDMDLGGQVRMNSTARLLAGLPPTYPGHARLADTASWRQHGEQMRAAWGRLAAERVSSMTAWRARAIAEPCPAGRTLLYPFSGPDFFNAYWLFPECERFVLFGLEHLGSVPEVDRLNEKALERLLADVRAATSDLLDRNYFITENMSRQLRTRQLHGVVPLLIIPMALSGVEILRIVPHEINQTVRNTPRPAGGSRVLRQLSGVVIDFRLPGSTQVKRVEYFTVDATDSGLARYPELLDYLGSLGSTSTILKAASYLLHSRNFSRMRDTLLEVSDFIIQDDTGLPYQYLSGSPWEVRLYGNYEVPIPPFERAFQPALARAYKVAQPDPLPFDFGYAYSDRRDNRANILVARRLGGRESAADTRSSPGAPLKTVSRIGE